MTTVAFTPLRPDDPPQVGVYRLTGQLGSGGMGIVYLARTRAGTPVALKLIRPEYATDPTFRARFGREVEVGRRVQGVCIARFLDADPDAERPYLVTEYVDGPGLDEVVAARGPFRGPQLQALAAGLAEGLVSLHGAGVVHRDLKPSNVLLARDAPKIIDFGIAYAADAVSMTRTGHVVGSAGWMSPEQALGKRVTGAGDVFAWASTMSFAATGRSPFGEGQPTAVIYRVVHHEPDLDGVPGALLSALHAAFAKDPAARPAPSELLATVTGDAGVDPSGEITRVLDVAWLPVAPVAVASAAAARAALAQPLPMPTFDQPPPRLAAGNGSRPALVAAAVVLALLLGVGAAWGLSRGVGSADDAAPSTTGVTSIPESSTSSSTSTSTSSTSTSTSTTTTTVPPDADTAWADVEGGLPDGTASAAPFDGPDGQVALTAAGTEVTVWSWDGEEWSEVSALGLLSPIDGPGALNITRLTGLPSDDVLVRLEDDRASVISLPDIAGRIVEFAVPYSDTTVFEVNGASDDDGRIIGGLDDVDTQVTWRYDPGIETFDVELVDGEPLDDGSGNSGNGQGNGGGGEGEG